MSTYVNNTAYNYAKEMKTLGDLLVKYYGLDDKGVDIMMELYFSELLLKKGYSAAAVIAALNEKLNGEYGGKEIRIMQAAVLTNIALSQEYTKAQADRLYIDKGGDPEEYFNAINNYRPDFSTTAKTYKDYAPTQEEVLNAQWRAAVETGVWIKHGEAVYKREYGTDEEVVFFKGEAVRVDPGKLDETLPPLGGKVSPVQRAKWIAYLKDVIEGKESTKPAPESKADKYYNCLLALKAPPKNNDTSSWLNSFSKWYDEKL